ncbi:MAG: hypothetical protein KGI27_10715 [Thaumarchaeota archaeon]|nr:hypothetical protein [Nitrososphaerota archaeon]
MSDDFVKNIKTLLASGKGDAKRLMEILDFVKQSNPVYMSDYKYVQNLISDESSNTKMESADARPEIKLEDQIALLRMRLAEGKITIAEFRELKKTIIES